MVLVALFASPMQGIIPSSFRLAYASILADVSHIRTFYKTTSVFGLPVNPYRQCFRKRKFLQLRGYATAKEVEHATITLHCYLTVNAENGIAATDTYFHGWEYVKVEIFHIITSLISLKPSVIQ